ncbi:MAG: RidA family protein [Chloroflexi bacterium]|nr:RidA family protein [Chloroflexota bacterium]
MATNERKVIQSEKAPKAIGPYSVAIESGGFVFCAGQTGIDPSTGELVSAELEAQTRQVLTNLRSVLEAAGTSLDRVVKTTVFLRDMADFPKMNAIYAEYFSSNPPARSTIAVAGLPKGGIVEIEAIAVK